MEVWKPFVKQEEALLSTCFETLFGGARGPGKTDTGMVWLLKPLADTSITKQALARYRALVIRKNSTDLTDWLDRASFMYDRYGAKLGAEANAPVIRFPGGGKIRTGHLKDEQAYTKYQGHEYQRELVEELNQIPNERRYLQLISSCRSTVDGIDARVFATTNPGGLGHGWIKKRFIDVAAWGTPFWYEETINGVTLRRARVFIHSTMDDNPVLSAKDPGYVLTIEQLKHVDPELYQAWRYGNWDVFAGQMFREFNRALHVMPPTIPGPKLSHFLAIDWGYSGNEGDETAFAAYASVIKRETFVDEDGDKIPFNRVVTYREWAGKHKTPEQWAQLIYETAPVKKIDFIVKDSSMFNPQSDGSVSISDLMRKQWTKSNGNKPWAPSKPGTKNRIGRVATMHNWLSLAPDGLPYWLVTENCVHLIRTLPALVRDEHKVEDVDTDMEDHPYDALTYGLTYVKFIAAGLGAIGTVKKRRTNTLPAYQNALDLSEFEKASIKRR